MIIATLPDGTMDDSVSIPVTVGPDCSKESNWLTFDSTISNQVYTVKHTGKAEYITFGLDPKLTVADTFYTNCPT